MGYKTFLRWQKDLGFYATMEWPDSPGVVVMQVDDRDWLTLGIFSGFTAASLKAILNEQTGA